MYTLYYMTEYTEPTENKKILVGEYENLHDAENDIADITKVLNWVHPIIDKEITTQFIRIEKNKKRLCDIY